MVNFDVTFASPLYSDISSDLSKNLDINKTLKNFWQEMSELMNNYSELSLNPDASKSMQIGHMTVAGDQVNSSAVTLLIENRLAQIEQAQTGLLNIYDRMRKLEDQLNSAAV